MFCINHVLLKKKRKEETLLGRGLGLPPSLSGCMQPFNVFGSLICIMRTSVTLINWEGNTSTGVSVHRLTSLPEALSGRNPFYRCRLHAAQRPLLPPKPHPPPATPREGSPTNLGGAATLECQASRWEAPRKRISGPKIQAKTQ